MKKLYFSSVATSLLLLLSACGTSGTTSSEPPLAQTQADTTETSTSSTQATANNQEADNNTHPSNVNVKYHNQGLSCAKCHGSSSLYQAPQRSDENENENENENDNGESVLSFLFGDEENEGSDTTFDSGVTIFTTIDAGNKDAKKAAYGYSLRLVLESGESVNYVRAKGTGNLLKESFNAGITNYTAQVLDGNKNVVNTSKANSHTTARFDCNSCHTASGNNGAPGRVVNFSYTKTTTPVVSTPTTVQTPTTTATNTQVPTTSTQTPTTQAPLFASNVKPILQNYCAGCHGGSGRFSITNSTTAYSGVTPWIDTTNAGQSRLLLKATNSIGHAGGRVFSTSSTAYTTIRDWIAAGGNNN